MDAAGYTVIDRELFRYVIESIAVSTDGRQATVVVCIADGSKLVLPGAGPGGVDVMIDEAFVSARDAFDMRLDADGVWRAYAAPAVGTSDTRDICPAS